MFDPLVPVIVFLVTAGAKEFFAKVLGKELDANTSVLIASVVAAFAVYANQLAAMIPASYLPVVGALVTLAVTIASAFGIHATIKSLGAK